MNNPIDPDQGTDMPTPTPAPTPTPSPAVELTSSDKVYLEILNDTIKSLQEQIKEIKTKTTGDLNDKNWQKVKGLELQIEGINAEIQRFNKEHDIVYRDDAIIRKDEKAAKIDSKAEELSQKIEFLKQQKEQLQTKRAKKIMTNEITKKQEILTKLRKKTARISKKQKPILLSRYKKDLILLANQSKAQARVDLYDSKLNDLSILESSLDTDKLIDSLKSKVYALQGKHYMKQKEHSEELLQKVTDRNAKIQAKRSQKSMSIPKKAVNKLRRKMQDLKDNIINKMLPPKDNTNTNSGPQLT